MAIFNRKKASPEADKKEEGKKPEEVTAKKPAKPRAAKKTEGDVAKKEAAPASEKAARYSGLLLSPRVSEKAAILASTGRYVFNVPVSSNKVEVRKAVEALYGVKVASVNTVRGEGKVVRRGRVEGRRNNWKKAIVILEEGQKLDLYEGV